MEANDPCIFCGMDPCECAPKKAAKPKPKRKKSPPPSVAPPTQAAQKQDTQPQHRVKTEAKKKAAARPERDASNLVSAEARNRKEESELFWSAMRNLVNESMVHEISVKRALDVYPSIPKGLY